MEVVYLCVCVCGGGGLGFGFQVVKRKLRIIAYKKLLKKTFARLKKYIKKMYFLDETEGVSNVNMTENREIPDHPWP